jgi:hypothetical protein
VSRAEEQFGVVLVMVELPEGLREDIVAAQDLRVMVNVSPDQAAAIVEE